MVAHLQDSGVLVYGYAKNNRANVTAQEIRQFKKLAVHVLALTEEQLQTLVKAGRFEEIDNG